mgnify:CR=1 FL=1
MLPYTAFRKTLQPYLGNAPDYCVKSVEQISEKHVEVLNCVSEYYATFASHAVFLQSVLNETRSLLTKYGVEYSERGIDAAKDRLLPIVEKFKEQKHQTDKVSHAILYLVIEYVKKSPFNRGVSLEEAPTLAVMGVNIFLVAFASTILAMSVVRQKLITE